jgi:phospholipase/lecithinase/hemolysin
MRHNLFRSVLGVAVLLLLSLLTSCGGSSSTVNPLRPTRIIAFGDAFSDVGNPGNSNGGSRYTIRGVNAANTLTTPSTLAEGLANVYGLWGNTVAMQTGQAGAFPTTGLVSYAMGNSMINPAAAATAKGGLGGTEATLTEQVNDFLTRVDNKVGSNDLILITAGTKDLFSLAYRYFGSVGVKKSDGTVHGLDATLLAKLGGAMTEDAVYAQLDDTVVKLIAALEALRAAGAKHVLVVEPMNLSRTPWGLSLDKTANDFLRSLSYDTDTSCINNNQKNSFHCKLTIALVNKYPATVNGQFVLAVDQAQLFNLISGTTSTGNANTYQYYFSQLPTLMACAVTTPGTTPIFDTTYSALDLTKAVGCNASATIWTDTAYTSFLFADPLHLTPQGNALLAASIYNSNMYRAAWR